MNEKTDYGNWVPEKALYMLFGLAAVFLVAAVICGVCVKVPVAAVICAVICVLTLAMAVYMFVCHEKFALDRKSVV